MTVVPLRVFAPLVAAVTLVCCSLSVEGQMLQQYCSFTPQHTLCRTTGLGTACGVSIPARGVQQHQAAVIVAQHNQLRARVALGQETRGAPGPQPGAANMRELMYDEELSLLAQRLADQCLFEHDCADCRQVERFFVGQNLFISFQSDLDPAVHWPRAVQAWYDEVDLFANGGVSSYNFDPSTGHYTALVWGDTHLVGCGFTMYQEGGWYKKLYVCNYGPTGNIIFTPMYQPGPACSTCSVGTSCSLAYPGLCAANTSPLGNVVPQALGTQTLQTTPAARQNRNKNRNQPGRRNNQQRQRNNNVVAKTVAPGPTQPFQIVQPFQLLQASGLANPSLQSRSVTTVAQNLPIPTTSSPMIVLENSNAPGSSSNLPNDANLQSFLSNFGKSSQVIRTNSLDSVRAIINSLPQHSQPLVFFRSNMGTIRQLNNLKLSGDRLSSTSPGTTKTRTIRSTITPAIQRLEQIVLPQVSQLAGTSEQAVSPPSQAPIAPPPMADLENMLLSCQDVSAPCPVVALSGNWTHGSDSRTNVVRSSLSPSMGGQLVLGQTIPAPASRAACVTLSYNFTPMPTDAVLPQVQVAVWPLGQVLLQEDLDEVSTLQQDGWRKTQVSFAPIRNPFMVVLSVEPNPGPDTVELALRGFMVTEGLC